MSIDTVLRFAQLGLAAPVLQAIEEIGYETPSPIQACTIPPLLAGRDVLGQAQTGTGKTGAFALPLLSRIDLDRNQPQAIILTPTRELAIQVAEAVAAYARHLPGLHVLPIYGGQPFGAQLRALQRGVHVVVGTPGRVLDHLGRGTLSTDAMSMVVLDEADEMLRMGFIDDVETILDHLPEEKQVALFSATMPPAVARIARKHLRDPEEVKIASKTSTVAAIRQTYWRVEGVDKVDALTRILEATEYDAMIVFVRTKNATVELAERLEARGHAATPLNGDMSQELRERAVQRLRNGTVDIVVATDIAARGLDVERISHVINFDIPYDTEAYVHRIGRTGRAGRTGEAILFVLTRERRLLRAIEAATGQTIEPMQLPSLRAVADRQAARFRAQVLAALTDEENQSDLDYFEKLITQLEISPPPSLERRTEEAVEASETLGAEDSRGAAGEEAELVTEAGEEVGDVASGGQERPGVSSRRIAAALAWLLQGDRPLLTDAAVDAAGEVHRREGRSPRPQREDRGDRPAPDRSGRFTREDAVRSNPGGWEARSGGEWDTPARPRRSDRPAPGKARYRLAVGKQHEVSPRHIVGAIANEAGIDGREIGPILVLEDCSFVDLPAGMPKALYQHLKNVVICGEPIRLKLVVKGEEGSDARGDRPARPRQHPMEARFEGKLGPRFEGKLAPRLGGKFPSKPGSGPRPDFRNGSAKTKVSGAKSGNSPRPGKPPFGPGKRSRG